MEIVKSRFLVCREDEILHTVDSLPIARGILEALKHMGQETDGLVINKLQQVFPSPPPQRKRREKTEAA